jgi:iron complex outermembrane receptor protein
VDGVWSGRDADLASVTGRWTSAGPGRLDDVFVGAADRDLGAQDFYAPLPGRERTRVLVATGRSRRQVGSVTVEPRLGGRLHRDEYTLDRYDRDRYHNDHRSGKVEAGVRAAVPLAGAWSLSGDLAGYYEELQSEGIRSGQPDPALGDHVRRRGAIAAELTRNLLPVSLQFGGRLDAWQGEQPHWGGTATVSWSPRPVWSLHGTVGTLYRLPTVTERYYEDPFNRGDPDLRPETGWSWDAGARLDDGRWLASATYFERHEEDLIDWARPAGSDEPWQVQNIPDGLVRGVELRGGWRHGRGHLITAGWQYLDAERTFAAGTEAKYDLLVPRHHVTVAGTAVLPLDLLVTLQGRYLERTGGPDAFRESLVADARLRWRAGRVAVNLDVLNLTDERYEEVPGAVMPGRTVTAGAEVAYGAR